MYLSELKLWNFRKYSNEDGSIDLTHPHLIVPFSKGLNVLIGENDSGKTAILDAIRLVLKTHAYERILPQSTDFYNGTVVFRIELLFSDITDNEAMHFTEWLSWGADGKPSLRLVYQVKKVNDTPLYADVCAGADVNGSALNADARKYLKTTYLKALRDADTELTAKKNSRLSQILEGHQLFQPDAEGTEILVENIGEANKEIKNWFNKPNEQGEPNEIKTSIEVFLHDFISENSNAVFSISGSRIKEILEKLSIDIDGEMNLGLGTLNRLYMATELLHVQRREWSGLRLCLIEEMEAHLHPQAQMKVIKSLQQQKEQYILTTHSPNLASIIKMNSKSNSQVLLCKDKKVFSMSPVYTMLSNEDYVSLENFLDVTKANLFFAKGLILVEGWAEEILIPAICDKIGCNLTDYEVSIINVGSTAYLKYAKVFMRKDQERINVPVSIVTDNDERPDENGNFDSAKENAKKLRIKGQIDVANYPDIKWNLAAHWTLEWCLYKSKIVGNLFKKAAKTTHPTIFSNDDDFEHELICRLRKYRINNQGKIEKIGGIDKVAVAYKLVELINEEGGLDWTQSDNDGIKYLVDAIKHACRI